MLERAGIASPVCRTCATNTQKLRLDFADQLRLYGVMTDDLHLDPDRLDLIAQLCTQAGMIMEDASAAAVQRPPDRVDELLEHVRRLQSDAATAMALLAAAEASLR